MSLAYKRSGFTLGVLYLVAAISMEVQANECSSLKFNQTEIDGKTYIAKIKLNNGMLLQSEMRKFKETLSSMSRGAYSIGEQERRIVNGTKTYFLAEGTHDLTVEIWKKKQFKNLYTSTLYSKNYFKSTPHLPVKVSTFNLKVEKDLAYDLDFKINGEIGVKYSHSECELKSHILLSADNKLSETVSNKALPQQLEQRLRVIMNKVFASGEPLGVIKSRVSDVFGAVTDNNYNEESGDIRLLSVLPFSLAYNIGLLSGDVIVGYGDEEYATLAEFLVAQKNKKNIEVNVLRNGSLIELKTDYQPVVVPQVLYGVNEKALEKNYIGEVNLNKELQFEFERLMLEVSNFYLENNYKGKLNLIRHNAKNSQFGLIGTLNTRSSSEYTIHVDEVFPFSAAKQLGLEVGDHIISVNNESMNSRNITHINRELKKLDAGEEYLVSIEREGKNIVLNGNFKSSEFLPFNLHVDLDATSKYQLIVAHIERIYRTASMSRKRLQYRDNRNSSGVSRHVKLVQRMDKQAANNSNGSNNKKGNK
jgi:C-terminal processing protease CtpA/Prc